MKMMLTKAIRRNMFFVILIALLFNTVHSKEFKEQKSVGWKTSGNGYLEYKASTSFSNTKQLMFNGTFATTKNNFDKNLVFALEDSNGDVMIIYYVSHGISHLSSNNTECFNRTNQETNGYVETETPDYRIISGEIINFAFLLSESSVGNRVYTYSITRFINYSFVDAWKYNCSRRWNLDNITIFIGGYKLTTETYFHGCLSDFIFDGFNIIDSYFDQYENDEKQSKGSLVAGSFNNNPEKCENSEPGKQSTSDATTNGPPSTALSLRPKSIIFLSNMFLPLLFCKATIFIFQF